jgi:plastocyanin
MLLGLSTGHKLGLALVGAAFIFFALASAFLIPRFRPDYPGPRGLRFFLVGALALFVGMMAAVYFFGKEAKEAKGGEAAAATGGRRSVKVTEVDFKIKLPQRTFSPGGYEFDLTNDGPSPHNLTINGPGVSNAATPTIGKGKTAKVDATLKAGTYEFYCSVPGHKQLGMDLHVKVA